MSDDQARWLLESSQAIQMRLDEMERTQQVQLHEIKAELKAIYWMACWCALAAIIYVATTAINIFR